MTIPNDAWMAEHLDELVATRRDIHAHPELGMEEHRTAALVADRLRRWGIETETGIGRFGVVGTIRGRDPGRRAIGLRADMDALAIHEETGLPWASTIPGKMHGCGHDGHTTMLLGAARYLSLDPDFAGTLHLIFQPAEEGRGGAAAMVADGLFRRFPCDAVYGLHNTSGMPVGRFGIRPGPMLAASDQWEVVFTGPGGHGGVGPHLSNDITYAAAHFVLGLQGIVGRNVPPLETAVLSVGHIAAGERESPNVIPARLVVSGTARSYTEQTRDTLERRLVEVANMTAAAWGCQAEPVFRRVTSALVNTPENTALCVDAATSLVGAPNVNGALPPTTGGEDFAEMLAVCPGAYMRIGNGAKPDGTYHATHTPRYDFNDEIIPLGIRYWVGVVARELGREPGAHGRAPHGFGGRDD